MLASGLLVMGCVTHPFLRHVRVLKHYPSNHAFLTRLQKGLAEAGRKAINANTGLAERAVGVSNTCDTASGQE